MQLQFLKLTPKLYFQMLFESCMDESNLIPMCGCGLQICNVSGEPTTDAFSLILTYRHIQIYLYQVLLSLASALLGKNHPKLKHACLAGWLAGTACFWLARVDRKSSLCGCVRNRCSLYQNDRD